MPRQSAAPDTAPPLGKWYTLLIFLCFASAYFLSYSLRSVNATLAPYLTHDLALTAADLGWLSSAYFIAFAVLQYPLGFWLDRYGARRVESGLLLVAAAGSLIMALGTTLAIVSIGRILVGLGVAACLMAPFSYLRRCYPAERQAQLGLWLLVAGTSGAVASTLPAGMMAASLGWRTVFSLYGILLLLVAVAIFFVVPDRDLAAIRQTAATAAAAGKPDHAQVSIIRHPIVLRLLPIAVINLGGLMALHTLWAGPWMTDVLGMDNHGMARTLFLFMLTMMFSYLAMSFISPVLQRRGISLTRIGVTGFTISCVTLFFIAALPYQPAWPLWLMIALIYPAQTLLQPALTLYFPKAMAGRVLTVYNLFSFAGAFLMQWGIGVLIDTIQRLGAGRPTAYQLTFLMLAILQALCLLWFTHRARRSGTEVKEIV